MQGDSSISITQTAAARRTTTAGSAPSAVAAGVLGGLFLLLVGAGVVTAAPAAAVDDPTRPDARVTHGPSCRPGGLVVEVRAGTSPYFVRLSTTRQPGGEDQATVVPGTTVVLRTGDVAWGETIDGRLEYAARDGSGVTFVDELDDYSFTRPAEEDCDAVHDPTQPHPPPPPSAPDGAAATGPGGTGSASAGRVAPGGTVTVDGAGFLPGERVVVELAGTVLGAVTAAPDGSVRAQVRIPERTGTGLATVDLVGDDSAVVAGIDLQIADVSARAAEDDVTEVLPLVTAAGALVATAAGLASVAGRQRATAARRRPLRGSA